MSVVRDAAHASASSLALFGAVALLLAFGGASVDRVVVRLIIEFPILLLVAAIMMFAINLVAAFVGIVVTRMQVVAALVAALLAWGLAGPPEFAGLGYHWLLRPVFAIAIAIPWLINPNLLSLLGRKS
jgi:hypothetical protein